MPKRDIIVVGTSAGGVEALIELCQGLPPDLPAAVFVVCHISAHSAGALAKILARKGNLPAENAIDREPITPGRVYVAPPDHHLLVEHGFVRVTQGPKENRFRPAVDPLFRSAAYAYGSRVIGVILTGGLDDGTAGLWAIKERGGLAIVQDPADAVFPSMPTNAIMNVQIDYQTPLAEIAPLLARIVSEPVEEERQDMSDKLEIEVNIAREDKSTNRLIEQLGHVSMFTCPECHGTLWEMYEGGIIRFRCRTGHGYTAQALLADQAESIEAMLWSAIRGIEEGVSLLNHMAEHLQQGQNELSESFLAQARAAVQRADLVRQATMAQENPKVEREAEAVTLKEQSAPS
jgi:two-component system, chemotaxis family, protein-glutamate methylesterase/glutaminase